jgi:uncharacterized protein YndB with AHSA1/START domain
MAELVREVLIDARPEIVFEYLTVPSRHVEWQGTEAELDPRPGGVFRVLVGGNHHAAGEFVEVIPNEKVVITFGWDVPGHPIPAGSSIVEYTLHAEGDKTRLRLVHRNLPDDAVVQHTHGWDHYLARLAIAGSGGDAGPDSGPAGS